jgi:hypothetical protein
VTQDEDKIYNESPLQLLGQQECMDLGKKSAVVDESYLLCCKIIDTPKRCPFPPEKVSNTVKECGM